jgi:hypothetical protein
MGFLFGKHTLGHTGLGAWPTLDGARNELFQG